MDVDMLTGLEPIIGKAAIPAVSRVTGWGASVSLQRMRDRKLRKYLRPYQPATDHTDALLDQLTADQASALYSFCSSAEFEHVAMNITIAHYLPKCSDQQYSGQAIKGQLHELLRLAVGLEDSVLTTTITEAIYSIVERNVLEESAKILPATNALPPHARSSLIKNASALASSLARNSDLLRGLAGLSEIRTFEYDLRSQMATVHRSMRLPHAGISRLVAYDKLFVQPTIHVDGHDDSSPIDSVHSLAEVLELSLHTVLLGDPGGGKSTASLKLTHDIAAGKLQHLPYRVPFLVVLKDYAEEYTERRTSIVDYLNMLCATPYAVEPPTGAIEYLLRNGSAIVIFDGLDELLATALRADVVQAVDGFASRFPTTPILVTSRRVGYEEAALDQDVFVSASLEGFGRPQVESYARRWFSLDDSIPDAQKNALAESFLADSDYVDDLRGNPLMLSLMCGLYSGERYIPKNRPDVYEKCATLLFERWDKQRGILAPLPFDAHVQASLRSLALWLYPQQERRKGLPRAEFVRFMTDYLNTKRFDDRDQAERAANEFIDFCRGRAWVLTDVGAELYWFTHQTFLEFFAASQLVRENTSANRLFDQIWQRIRQAEWDVVAQLSVQTLGRAVEDGADDFLEKIVLEACSLQSPSEHRNALSFAARALAFIVPRPSVLRQIVRSCIDLHVDAEVPDEAERKVGVRTPQSMSAAVIELGRSTPENITLIRKYALERLVERCRGTTENERALELAMYWSSLVEGVSRRLSSQEARSADQYQFQVDVVRTLGAEIGAGCRKFAWIMAYLVEDGKLPVSELITSYGIAPLYECVYGGDIIDPPIAWKIMHSLRAEPWPNPKGKVLDRPLVQSIYFALLEARQPWFEYSKLMEPARGAVIAPYLDRPRPSDQLARSAALLLSLPLAEVSQRDLQRRADRMGRARRRSSGIRYLPDFVGGSYAGMDERQVVDPYEDVAIERETELDRLSKFDVTPEAFELAKNWIARRVSLTGRASPRV